MRTRIKYTKRFNGSQITSWFNVRPNYIIRAILRSDKKTYVIEELEENRIIIIGKAKNERLAKIAIRNNLKICGLNLFDEIRQGNP